jgi:sec-independent protein translocase protein TatC
MTELMDDQDSRDEHLAAGRMTIWEHIAELRTRLIRCCIAVAVGMALGFFLYPYLIEFLKLPYQELTGKTEFLAFDPLEPFATRLKISAYVGIVFAMPVLLWQIWRFVTPGLYPHEKRYAVPFVVSACFLFVFGAAIAYFTLNPALQFLQGMGAGQVDSFYTIDNYVTLIAYMMLAFGIGFEFPVLLVALQIAGVLTPRKLLGWWRQAVVTIAVVAAVITPSGDPISMMALAVPMYIFYLIAVGIGFVLARSKRKKAQRVDTATAG